MKVILEEPNTHVYLDEERRYIEIQVENHLSLASYQFAYEHALSFARKNELKKLLVNEMKLKNQDYKMKIWFAVRFVPTALKWLGMDLKIAVVREESPLTIWSGKALELAHKKLKAQMEIVFFKDEEKASEWISNV